MHFGIIDELFADPTGTLMFLLLALPGRLLAISLHEAAHAWVADRCGDPTARLMGRVTLNPLKHLDPVGVLMMLVLGIGWARPVPVNPMNYRNGRRDDLKVSIAGVTMNLAMFLLGLALSNCIAALALNQIPYFADYRQGTGELFRSVYNGVPALLDGRYYYDLNDLMRYGLSLTDILIVPTFGRVAGYLYDMLGYFTMTNLVLAVFNMIPLPPLDGYHVINDLLLKGRLFATRKSEAIGNGILYLAAFTGVLGDVLSKVYEWVLSGLGGVAAALMRMAGLF